MTIGGITGTALLPGVCWLRRFLSVISATSHCQVISCIKRPRFPTLMMFRASLKTGVRQGISAKGANYLPDLSGLNFSFQVYAAEEEPQQAILGFNEDEIRVQQNKRKAAEAGNWNLPLERWHMFS